MGALSWLERSVGDLDELLAYSTTRTLRVKDKRLGILYYALVLAIFAYIVAYQIVIRQAYLKLYPTTGVARLQLQQPSAAYRWPDASAPYCSGGSGAGGPPALAASYSFPTPGYYAFSPNGVLAPQLPCIYLDEDVAVPNALEANAIFLTSRLLTEQQAAVPATDCAEQAHAFCAWNTTSSRVALVADVEMFTLLLDHSMSAPEVGLTRTASQMSGAIEDAASADAMDACAAYRPYPAGCPTFIAVGRAGARDIVPLKALLNAAGIQSLDQVAGTDPSLSNETLRYSGLLLVVDIEYSNLYLATGSFNTSDIRYTYRISTVRNAEFKTQFATTSNNSLLSPERTIADRHGVRVVVSFSSTIGGFDLQTLLVNLTVSLGLLSVSVLLVDAISLNCCPLRHIILQYKERSTVDFSALRRAHKEDINEFLERFKRDPHLLEPVPDVFRDESAPIGGEVASGIADATPLLRAI